MLVQNRHHGHTPPQHPNMLHNFSNFILQQSSHYLHRSASSIFFWQKNDLKRLSLSSPILKLPPLHLGTCVEAEQLAASFIRSLYIWCEKRPLSLECSTADFEANLGFMLITALLPCTLQLRSSHSKSLWLVSFSPTTNSAKWRFPDFCLTRISRPGIFFTIKKKKGWRSKKGGELEGGNDFTVWS